MATATQTLETLQTEPLRVTRVDGKLIADEEEWMSEWAKARNCTNALDWFAQLIEAERAAYRLKKIVSNEVFFEPEDSLPSEDESRFVLNDKQKEEIRAQRLAGASVADLAKRFNCGTTTVRRAFERSDKKLDAAESQIALQLRCEGVSAKQIAYRFNVGEELILDIFAQYDSRDHVKVNIDHTHAHGDFGVGLGDLSRPGPGE